MGQKNAIAKLVVLIVVSAGLTTGLQLLGDVAGFRIDWSDPVIWFSNASAEDATGAALRTVGLAIGYWVTGSTLLYVAAAMRRKTPRPRLVSLITLPGIRTVVDRALATALTASITLAPLGPALAEQPPPTPVVFDIHHDGVPVPHILMSEQTDQEEPGFDATPVATGSETRVIVVPPLVPVVTTAAPPLAAVAAGYTVQPGDSLWKIADRHVHAETQDEPTTAAVTSYWKEVVAANRDTLRSGDPNLIFPGEIVVLPTLAVAP